MPTRRNDPATMATLRTTLVVGFALALLGCDPGSLSEAPPRSCSETGALCDLGGGPLGVCERARCSDGASGPCFHCAPQH